MCVLAQTDTVHADMARLRRVAGNAEINVGSFAPLQWSQDTAGLSLTSQNCSKITEHTFEKNGLLSTAKRLPQRDLPQYSSSPPWRPTAAAAALWNSSYAALESVDVEPPTTQGARWAPQCRLGCQAKRRNRRKEYFHNDTE